MRSSLWVGLVVAALAASGCPAPSQPTEKAEATAEAPGPAAPAAPEVAQATNQAVISVTGMS